ncbi:MAG TPA: sulfotransferase [Solirubrobacterales bacterium]|jgi:hypothetical protein|nr:sulfotransferase [Solirubrobacterales bacterium]
MADRNATAVVEIADVDVNRGESDYVHDANMDSPAPGSAADSYTFAIEGWILSRRLRVERIEALYEERPVAVTPLDRERKDIAQGFPEVESAGQSGYRLTVNSLRLPAEFELVLRAKLEDDTRLPLARLRGSRRRLPTSGGEEIQPLMVNTIGRSGSTLLVTLLSSHPEVVAFSPFIKDARVSTYWTNVMQGLSEPAAYLAPFDPPDLDAPRWWLEGGQELGDEELESWLGSEAVDSLVAMSRVQIEAFYAHVAGETRPRYFVEKYLPHQVVPDLLGEIYSGAREVVLVRDFRDILCSVIAFNRKRGWDAFGRSEGGDDGEYVRTTLRESGEILSTRMQRAATTPHLVRYEDLVLDPEPALTTLFEQLGLASDPELVAATIQRMKEDTASMDHHRTSADPAASIGRWRDDLPEEIAAVCEEELGPLLREFGYQDS